jgi:phenylpyruvate tautomerase PptA (4-oxalocrotonate tautomerase family)
MKYRSSRVGTLGQKRELVRRITGALVEIAQIQVKNPTEDERGSER